MTKNLIISDVTLTRQQEIELHAKFIAGDRDAGGLLIQAQSRWIMTILNRICHHQNVDVEDVLGEIMPEILCALQSFDPGRFKTKLSTYLCPVVRRNGMKAAMRLASRDSGDFDPNQILEPDDKTALAQDVLQQLKSIIQDAPRHALTEECRLIADRMFKGVSQDEISRELGWPPMRVSDALTQIKGLLAKRAIERHIDVSHWVTDERLEIMARKADSEESLF